VRTGLRGRIASASAAFQRRRNAGMGHLRSVVQAVEFEIEISW
jgi:hypothetical protein